MMIALVIFPQVRCFLFHPGCRSTVQLPSISRTFSINLQSNNDHDGWGDGRDSTVVDGAFSSSDESKQVSKNEELKRLQSDLTAKRTNNRISNSGAINDDSEDRDLFIPIVTLVSVIGFTGLYGYEMLRLYSRGELYLPWEQ